MNILNSRNKRSLLGIVLIVSLGLHLIGLAVFGAVKLVESITREEQTFEAPEITEVPQNEPEYVVNLEQRNQSSAPPRPNPITVDAPPEANLPALDFDLDVAQSFSYGRGTGGIGSGTGGGIREMSIELSSFGYNSFLPDTLEGTLFDFKKEADGDPTGFEPKKNIPEVSKELTRSFRIDTFKRRYFSADKKLFASYFIIPFQDAASAPRAFDAEGLIAPRMIGVAYQGSFKPRKDGRFRFYGRGDDILVVRINGRTVLDGSWTLNLYSNEKVDEGNERNFGKSYFGFPPDKAGVYGDWFDLYQGRSVEIEIFICEVPGGRFGAWLLIEQDDGSDPEIFSTRPLSKQDREYLLKLHPDSRKFMPK